MSLLRTALAGRPLQAVAGMLHHTGLPPSISPQHSLASSLTVQRRYKGGKDQSAQDIEQRQDMFGDTADQSTTWATENAARILRDNSAPSKVKTDKKGVVEEVDDHMLRVGLFGRQSVGKTRLFNCLTETTSHGLRADISGMTSDCRTAEGCLGRMFFTAIDTPGITKGCLPAQCQMIIHSVDLALFVVDAFAGLTEDDLFVSEWLKEQGVPVVVVANKSDEDEILLREHHQRQLLDHGIAIHMSGKRRRGFGALQDMIAPLHALREADRKEEEWDLEDRVIEGEVEARDSLAELRRFGRPIRVCITGSYNVGKSTLINALLGYDRCAVTNVPQTTRDPVNVKVRYRGQLIELVDTAGLSSKQKNNWLFHNPRTHPNPVKEQVNHWMHHHSVDVAMWSSVIVYVFDARFGFSRHDLRQVEQLLAFGRPIVLVANKWDEVEAKHDIAQRLQDTCTASTATKSMTVVCTSAKNGTNAGLLMETLMDHHRRWHVRISAGKLNTFWRKMATSIHIPRMAAKARRIIQVASCPPTFTVFLDKGRILDGHISKYMVNVIRREFGLDGIPIRLIQRRRPPAVFRQLGYTPPEKTYKNPTNNLEIIYNTWAKQATMPGSLKAAGQGRTNKYGPKSANLSVPSHLQGIHTRTV